MIKSVNYKLLYLFGGMGNLKIKVLLLSKGLKVKVALGGYRGKTGVGNIFVKPDLRLKSTPV